MASGSGCYIHIVENTALNVLKTAQAKGELKGLNALNYLADEMGIVCDDIYEKAEKVARKVLDDLYKPEYEKMELVEKPFCRSQRFKVMNAVTTFDVITYGKQIVVTLHQFFISSAALVAPT